MPGAAREEPSGRTLVKGGRAEDPPTRCASTSPRASEMLLLPSPPPLPAPPLFVDSVRLSHSAIHLQSVSTLVERYPA